MVNKLNIENFKSIRKLNISCKKINVFIGEPNSGKSNIIEALSLLSQDVVSDSNLKEVIRFKTIGDLFFDSNINVPITINTGLLDATLQFDKDENGLVGNKFTLKLLRPEKTDSITISISHNGDIQSAGVINTPFLYYEYKRLMTFQSHFLAHLAPPFGKNLPNILLSNPDLRKWVSDFFRSKGFKLQLKPVENDINISKEVDDELYSYPYFTISETLQRVVFYTISMESNRNKVLLFDEPETNTFPFYTKYLGERIALDETNQFFITTHNPYLLLSLIEKSKTEDINVCVVKMKNYETKVDILDKTQVSQILDLNSDVFFNLDSIVA